MRVLLFFMSVFLTLEARANSPELLQPMLSDPFVYDQEANAALVTKYHVFREGIEDAWLKHGLQTKLRQLKQKREPMTSELLSRVVEDAHRALLLRRETEKFVKKTGRLERRSLATIARYMENVYVPMLGVQNEGGVYEEVAGLRLSTALFPNFFDEFGPDELRAPAAAMEAGQSATRDASAYSESVAPLLNDRLKGYAGVIQAAAAENKRMGEIEKQIADLQKQNNVRVRSSAKVSQVVQKKVEADRQARSNRIKALQDEISKLKPKRTGNEKQIVEFFAEASRLTTLQLMLSQTHFYRELNDDPTPIQMGELAPACREKYKELTPTIRFELASKEERLLNMEMFLANNGLVFSETPYLKQDDLFRFYLDGQGRDPFAGYMSGMMPFHQLRVAQKGKRYTMREDVGEDWSDLRRPQLKAEWRDLGAPAFDDLSHYMDVSQSLIQAASSGLMQEDADSFQPIVTILSSPMGQAPEFGQEGFEAHLEAMEWVGFSPYLRDKLKSLGKSRDQWLFAIPQDVYAALTSNQIRMEFPPFYGPEPYKQWALRLLYKALSNPDTNARVLSYMCRTRFQGLSSSYAKSNVDTGPYFSQETCAKYKSNDDLVANLKSTLAPFEDRGPFIPASLSYSQGLRESWGELRNLWSYFLDSGNLSNIPGETSPIFNEFNFINTQMGVNPWVMLRVSVLVAQWELQNGRYVPYSVARKKPELVSPKKTSSNQRGFNPALAKESSQRARLRAALQMLPVSDLKRPVRPMYANTLYARGDEGWKLWKGQDEKDYYRIWDAIEQRYHDDNAHIFKIRADGQWDHYNYLERLETRTLLTREDVEAVIKGYRLEKEGSDPSEMYELLALAHDSEDAARFEVIKSIMESPGDLEKHQKILNDHIMTQGREEDFDDPNDVKLAFLKRDMSLKYPLMTQIMKIAARKRAVELEKSMETLCRLDPAVEGDWDNIMSMTAQTQKAFNAAFNLEGIPPEVMKFYDRGEGGFMGMSKRDERNMGMMIFGFVGLAMASGACASGIGSVAGCPLAVTLFTVLSAGALSYSAADFVLYAVEKAQGREERMRLGKQFHELGFSDQDAVNRRKGAGWGGVAWEVVTAGTMFVPVGLATKVVGRQTISIGAKYAIKSQKLEKPGVDLIKTAFEAVDINGAKGALKIFERSPRVGNIMARFWTKLQQYTSPKNYWNAFKREFLDEAVVDVSVKTIDTKTGEVLAEYFKKNPKAFATFVEGNLKPRFERLEKLILKAEASGDPKVLTKIQTYFHGFRYKPDRLVNFQSELLNERKVISALVKDLNRLKGDDLATYISKHADTMAPLLSDFTYHWWRLPGYAVYELFFHGAPWGYTNKLFLRGLTGRAFVKHVFASREKLLFHLYRREAQEGLELGSNVAMFDQLKLLHTSQSLLFKTATELSESGEKASEQLADKLFKDWNAYRFDVAKKIAKRVHGDRATMQMIKEVERKVFETTSDQMVEARKLTRKLASQDLFEIADNGQNVDILLRQMSSETKNMEKLADYVSLLSQRVKMLATPARTHEVISY